MQRQREQTKTENTGGHLAMIAGIIAGMGLLLWMQHRAALPASVRQQTALAVASSDPEGDALAARLLASPSVELNKLRTVTIPDLFAKGEYDAAASQAVVAVATLPQFAESGEQLLAWRVKALAQLGRYDQAWDSARAMYNLATIRGFPGVVTTMTDLARTTPSADGTDMALESRLRFLLMAGSGDSHVNIWSVLARPIPVDSLARDSRLLRALASRANSNWYGAQIERGNLFLIVNRPADAMTCFSNALSLAKDSKQQSDAALGIARAMKAADGNTFRANQFASSPGSTAVAG